MKILLLGSTDLSASVAHYLNGAGFTISGIVSAAAEFRISYRPRGMLNARHVDMHGVAQAIDATFARYDGLDTIRSVQDQIAADLLLAVGWHHMVPQSVRKLFSAPCLGVHASLLPKYRGGAPLNWALLNDEKETGVSVFELVDGVDAGPLFGQERFDIGPDDTIGDLVQKAQTATLTVLSQILRDLIDGSAIPWAQHGQPSYGLQRFPEDGEIDWTDNADAIVRLIRAVTRPYPGAFSSLAEKRIVFWSACRPEGLPSIYGRPGQIVCIKESDAPLILAADGPVAIADATFAEGGDDAMPTLRRSHQLRMTRSG